LGGDALKCRDYRSGLTLARKRVEDWVEKGIVQILPGEVRVSDDAATPHTSDVYYDTPWYQVILKICRFTGTEG
jgi:hypothetical protein